MHIKEYLKSKKNLVDKELFALIPDLKERPKIVHKAIRHALKGGKRVRPILCLASSKAAGGREKDLLKVSCAIEMIHAYSLVHDDLPSMDNADYRRGLLSCHKKFGVANAILAGDALLTLSFNLLSGATKDLALNSKVAKELSYAAGTFGMIGGQAIDISSSEKDLLTLEYINIHKTGALIAASCKIGAMAAKAKPKDISALFKFGEYIGLVFQIVDDILDSEGIAKLIGPKRAYEYAKELTEKAKSSISYQGKRARPLCDLADFILNRKH
ncbi:MAG: polyprenyl synthetase family protein [Candidatus Omnitrophica bacterium]|nr:polyprenyl synthetase family protein [Candidatus Omnitrophota bacterium]